MLSGQNPLEGKRAVTVPLAFAQSLLGMDGKVTEYVVAIKDVGQLDATAAALRASLGQGYEVQTWEDLRPGLRDMRLVQRAILGVVSFIFLIIALFGVANCIPTRLKPSLPGASAPKLVTRSMVARLFMLEALLQAALGATLGLGVAELLITIAQSRGGVTISWGVGQGYFHMMPTLLPAVPFIVVISACLGSVLAAVSPAMRAARMRPVEALSSP